MSFPESVSNQQSPPKLSPDVFQWCGNSLDLEPEACEGHLLIIQDDKGCREFFLTESVHSLGRHPKCDIRLYSLFISRLHATLVRRTREDNEPYYQIIDGNLKGQLSANGFLINGRKSKAHDLDNEDEIVFGPGVSAVYYKIGV